MTFNKVFFLKNAIDVINKEVLRTRNRVETGGILMGYCTDGNELVVTHASPPGKDAIQRRNSIDFDITSSQSFINEIYGLTKGYISYIGDWHSHTLNILEPSNLDKIELKKIATSKKARLENPIMLIAYGNRQQFYGKTFAYSNGLIYRIRDVIYSSYSFEDVI